MTPGSKQAKAMVDKQYPMLPRGPHRLAREKLRRAYLIGFEAGYRLAKAHPDPTP